MYTCVSNTFLDATSFFWSLSARFLRACDHQFANRKQWGMCCCRHESYSYGSKSFPALWAHEPNESHKFSPLKVLLSYLLIITVSSGWHWKHSCPGIWKTHYWCYGILVYIATTSTIHIFLNVEFPLECCGCTLVCCYHNRLSLLSKGL